MVYLMLFISLLVTGCNTMKGIGQDVEKTGETLKKSAEKNKNY